MDFTVKNLNKFSVPMVEYSKNSTNIVVKTFKFS
jgi:hypothetical protein